MKDTQNKMQRDIKFRAWWQPEKLEYRRGVIVNPPTMLQVGDNSGTKTGLDCCVYANQGQNVILMQYTGLKDSKGTEIYEGDILELRSIRPTDKTNAMEYGIGVVKYGSWDCSCGDYYCSDEGYGWFVEGEHGYDRRSGKIDRFPFLETIRHCENWIIIGNTYENSGLLK